jgi:hypothetical protein
MESQSQPTQQPMSTNFQSIDDFVREQEALDAVKSAQMKSRAQALLSNTKTKPKSKIKRVQVDVEAVAAEARAVAELGDTNWAGRLLGKGKSCFYFIIPNTCLTVLQNIAWHTQSKLRE